ncbi:MAG: hypothetical protein UW65_C0013G0011 [candidate division WWE3 bacterium GW2011_GWB1_44_4]|uniref:Glycosyltransferase RgtA/B/C/D-like domain-containing protein n=3 Tax=Katanobacteria TaxID=422282 RepID=A0A0G1KIG3_UNCKA|nr:MAG: hypothetical protein UW65_C0013G0011 [candidate division WWE3 bacterium GW2011_GWB1_44_4]KKT83506.1 MAG: hypothetical protein UW82_C0038G0002 [candidate division WWE3 bacterium GW2011_GWC2_44_9]
MLVVLSRALLGFRIGEMQATICSFKTHTPFVCFLLVYLIFALLTYKDYGITADEPRRREMGELMYKRVFLGLEVNSDKFADHYPLYDMMLVLLNPRGSYEFSHLLNMLFSSVLFIAAYVLLYARFSNSIVATLGPLFIVLTPTVFGHIPANPKDIPFAWGYLLSLALFYTLNKRAYPIIPKGLVLGLVVGFTYAMRLVGLNLFPIYCVLFFVFNTTKTTLMAKVRRLTVELSVMGLVSLLVMFATWSYIANDFPRNLMAISQENLNFSAWDREILYFGQNLAKGARPLSFVPVWILIATPVFVLAGMLTGLVVNGYALVKKRSVDQLLLALSFVLVVNIGMYLVVNPVLYNGPRLFLYFFPILSLIAALFYGGVLLKLKRIKLLLIGSVLAVIMLPELAHTIKLHPYEYVYFNPVVRSLVDVESYFESDYWSASFNEAFTKGLVYAKSQNISYPKVFACNNADAIKYYAQRRARYVESPQEAKIILCDTERNRKRSYPYPIVDVVTRDGIELSVVKYNTQPVSASTN